MKKKFFIMLLILFIIAIVAVYFVYNYRADAIKAQQTNREYDSYYNVNFLGTQLISLINKTVDYNEKNGIEKDSNQKYYINNDKNSIHIYIKFIYKNETKTLLMEDIAANGSQAFVSQYSTAKFKCIDIQYHEKTKNVSTLVFEEIQ